jgi:hypothetical protein
VVIERINNCIDFANAAKSAYTDKQIMYRALTIVSKTSLYADDLKSWKKRLTNEQTWHNFQEFMLAVQTEFRQQQATNEQIGYGLHATKMEIAAERMAAAEANSNGSAINIHEFFAMFNNKFDSLEKSMDAKLALICQPVSDVSPVSALSHISCYYHLSLLFITFYQRLSCIHKLCIANYQVV